MADRVGQELELLFQASAYQAEDDLVFGHPHTGHPLDRSQVSKRFKRTLKRAGVREAHYAPGANEAELVNGVFDAAATRATAQRATRDAQPGPTAPTTIDPR